MRKAGSEEKTKIRLETDRSRRFHKALRNHMTADHVRFSSVLVRRHLRKLIHSFPEDLSLLCYYPIENEIDLIPLYQEWMDHGRDLYFPVTDLEKKEIRFFQVDSMDSFRPGVMQVPEPEFSDEKHALSDEDRLLLSITPGLVFDRKGDRIGYGGGFYDRFFAEHPQIIRIGTAFSHQVEDRIPTEDWDMPLDYLVTDQKIYKF